MDASVVRRRRKKLVSVEITDKFDNSTLAVDCPNEEFRLFEASLYQVLHRTTANEPLRIVQQTRGQEGPLQFLTPHPCPFLSQPVHGDRKAFLAVTNGLSGSSNPATRPHALPGTTYPRPVRRKGVPFPGGLGTCEGGLERPHRPAPQHSEQGSPLCVRTSSSEQCLRLQSMTQRRCPSQGFPGNPYLHLSPMSGD